MNNRWGSFTAYSLVTGAADGPAGISTYARATVTGTQAGLGFHLAENTEAIPQTNQGAPIEGGQTYYIGAYLRISLATVGAGLKARAFNSGGFVGATITNYVATVAGVWTWVTLTIAAPATATHLAINLQTNDTPIVGTTIDGTGLVVTTSVPQFTAFADGNSPGWRWLGTAGASQSVGWPRG